MKKLFLASILLATVFTNHVAGQQYERMDYGPSLSATYVAPWPAGNITYRGIAVPFTAKVAGERPEGPIGMGKFGKKGPKGVKGTAPNQVYSTQRTGFGGYNLSVPPGTYKVVLHFCEWGADAEGKRIFDVVLQDKKVAEALDIFARVGQNKALDLTFEGVEVKQGESLALALNKKVGETQLCGLAVENASFKLKINCGGGNAQGFAADWPASFDAAANVGKAGVFFDAELLRYSLAWSGGFLKLDGVTFTGAHGPNPGPMGKTLVGTKPQPGWGNKGNFADPRQKNLDPRDSVGKNVYGPLPREWGRYKGMYRHDDGVLFKYTIGSCEVLDSPTFEVHDGCRFFCRTLNIQPSDQALDVALADCDAAALDAADPSASGIAINGRAGSEDLWISFHGGPPGTQLLVLNNSKVVLHIPAHKDVARIKIGHWSGYPTQTRKASAAFSKLAQPGDLTPLTKGGKARYPQTVTTKGIRGDDTKAAYTLDTITVPFDNPYKSWMRFGGLDFFADGKAAIATWSGDVWLVSEIDDQLQNVTWRRFASGLFQPLGLKVVGDVIHVLCRDGVFKLHDLNGDGEADYYECFNNEVAVTENFHEFIFELHTDPQGNFYFINGGPVRPGGRGWETITPHHGSLFKLSKDGQKLEVIARGFRAPNGMGLGPRGEITAGDNQGTWMPTTPINWVKPGGFYGVPELSQRNPLPTIRDNPLCWIPHSDPEIDNSNGCQVWITGKDFGPLSGQLLHTSYGTCKLFNVLKEEVGGQMQGGVVPIPIKFDSGICRARFVEKHNALYLVGLKGWQTKAAKDAGFYRVRYTGKPANLPIDLRVTPNAVSLTFSEPLDPKSVETPGNFSVQRWNYKWTQNYGSPHFKVSNPNQQGHDDMEITTTALSADGKTVTLKLKDIQPVMQMRIMYQLRAADGAAVTNQVLHTVNAVGDMRGEIHPGEFKIAKGR